jgi:hypothetical protein
VWPWTENYDRIRAMQAVIVRKNEEIDAVGDPEHQYRENAKSITLRRRTEDVVAVCGGRENAMCPRDFPLRIDRRARSGRSCIQKSISKLFSVYARAESPVVSMRVASARLKRRLL